MSITSNIDQITKRTTQRNIALTSSELLRKIALTLMASNIRRIHQDGESVKAGQIGNYSTEPIYISQSPKSLPKKGKTGGGKFKNGKARKSTFFANGYKGFRSAAGRDSAKVNLSLTGKLSKEFGLDAEEKRFVVGFLTAYAVRVGNAQEKKYGKQIWGVTAQDRKDITLITRAFVTKSLGSA